VHDDDVVMVIMMMVVTVVGLVDNDRRFVSDDHFIGANHGCER